MWFDLIGLYQFDNTLFDNLHLPAALQDQKDMLIDNLLMETAERELIYPDAGFMKSAIDRWSLKQCPIWEKLYETTQYDYNPIWNVDGKVIEDRDLKGTDYLTDDHTTTRTHTDTITRTNNNTDTRTHGLTDTITHGRTDTTTHGLTDTIDDSTYGYNSATAAPEHKRVDAQSGTTSIAQTGTTTDAQSGTTSDAHTGTITDAHTGSITDKDTGTRKHDTSDSGKVTTTRTGNIGVTSTQSLIQEQREVVKLNIFDVIIKDFDDRFILKVF